MQSVMGLYVVVFMVLGLVIYHSIFNIWYFNLTKALIGELFGALMFGILMAAVALYLWPVAVAIVILIGIALAAKVPNPTAKTIIVVVFVIVAIFTAYTGIKFKSQLKEGEKRDDFYDSLGSSPVDPQIHIVTNYNDYLFAQGKTYVSSDSGEKVFINAKYSKDNEPSFGYLEFNITYKRELDGLYSDGEYFIGVNSEDDPLKYYDMDGHNYEMAEIIDDSHFILSGDRFEEGGLSGKYSLANEEDIRYLQENMSELLADRIKEYASSGDEMRSGENAENGYNEENSYQENDSPDDSVKMNSNDGTYSNSNEVIEGDPGDMTDEELTEESTYVTVAAPDGYVNLRKGPGTDYDIIMPISNGEMLELQDQTQDGKWLKIAYWHEDGWYEGYVAASQTDYSSNNDKVANEQNTSDYICDWINEYELDNGTWIEMQQDMAGLKFPGNRSLPQMIINEIYAKHGYIFKSEDLNAYFGSKHWYAPKTSDMQEIENDLNSTERANIDFLKGVS